MAGSKTITNPSGAFGNTDPSSNQFQITGDFAQNGSVAIAVGDAVALVWDETARTVKVEAWDTDASGQTAKVGTGVALDAAAASSGDSIRVVLMGFALVNIGSGTATEGYAAKGTTTKGVVVEDNADASDIAGEILGYFLGDEDGTTNLAPIWVSPR